MLHFTILLSGGERKVIRLLCNEYAIQGEKCFVSANDEDGDGDGDYGDYGDDDDVRPLRTNLANIMIF